MQPTIEPVTMSKNFRQTMQFLIEVLEGKTYAAVAEMHGLSKSNIETRIKTLVQALEENGGIPHPFDNWSVFHLRKHRRSILRALSRYEPAERKAKPQTSVSAKTIVAAAELLRVRSDNATRDIALLFALFSTGAKPLEIARLRVRDYLLPTGAVRQTSYMPADAATNRKGRCLFFRSPPTCNAIDAYLNYRVLKHVGTIAGATTFRGLDPDSHLFLTQTGTPFVIARRRAGQRGHVLCRGILDVYRRIFRRAELTGVTTVTARRTVASAVKELGGKDHDIANFLGLKNIVHLRKGLDAPAPPPRPLSDVAADII